MSESRTGRLASLDALRGFDMFFITGGATLITALCTAFGFGDGWLARQMEHVPWAGLAHHDTIFPLFLFLAGVTWPFSLAAQQAKGRTSGQIHRKILMRAALLFAFGLAYGGIFNLRPDFRIPSVLGQIGLSWGLAALLFVHVRKPVHRLLLIAGVLVGYWAILRFTLAPDAVAGVGSFSREGNIISWLDRTLMSNHIHVRGVYDPESLFSCPNGMALALMGMCAGSVLRSDAWSGVRKTQILFGASLAALTLAALFVFVLGDVVVKALWTSSFVLTTAGYSLAMLALFHWVIDVKGWSGWTLYFRVIGMNSITIYLAQRVGVVRPVHDFLFGGLVKCIGGPWGAVVAATTYCAVVWALLHFLYRRNIFLRV